jgi:uncharacterized protein YqgV (UPF0045/DUF77 family)
MNEEVPVQILSAQVSLYPLRQTSLSQPIDRFLRALDSRGLEVRPGAMSTLVLGSTEALFDGLKDAFQEAADRGQVVMVATFSNACSTGEPEP